MEIRRKLYSRGSSYETTIPRPILFSIDTHKKHDVVFTYDPDRKQWTVAVALRHEENKKHREDAGGTRQ